MSGSKGFTSDKNITWLSKMVKDVLPPDNLSQSMYELKDIIGMRK